MSGKLDTLQSMLAKQPNDAFLLYAIAMEHKKMNEPAKAIGRVRDWLRTEAGRTDIPGAKAMQSRYVVFRKDLPAICERFELDMFALTFDDFLFALASWLVPTVVPRRS